MAKYICIILFSFLILQNATAQEYAAAFIAPELLKNANEVVRFEEKVFTAKSLKEGKLSYKIVVTILNQKSTANSFAVSYDKESKVNKIKARLYNSLGLEIRKIDKDEIRDFSAVSDFSIYEDNRRKYLEVSHSHYPYTIEFEYEMSMEGFFYVNYPNWFIQDYNASIEQGQFTIDLPETLSFFYQTLNIELEPQIKSEDGRKIYTWTVNNLPAIQKETFSPPIAEILPMIITTPEQFEWDGYHGSMRSWKDYGTFMYQLAEGRDKLPKDVATQVRTMTANAKTDVEKINILYQYLQQNMRYVSVQLGIGGWQPFDAEYVAERKYGDCKALTNYMKAILKEVGITAYPALIRSGDMFYEVTDSFTFPSFNHVILNIPSENYWLECTSSISPPNYITAGNDNRNVMLITEEGGKLVKTPALSFKDNLEQNITSIQLNEDGSAALSNKAILTGASQSYYRYLHHQLDVEDQKKYFIKNNDIPTANIEQFEILPSKDKPSCALSYSLNIPRYGSKAGRRFFIPVNVISATSYVPDPVEKRLHPIYIERGYTERDTFRFSIPEGYEIESIPKENAELSTDYARYNIKVEKTPDGFQVNRQLEIEAFHLPAQEYDNLRTFFKEVTKLDNMKVVLVQKKT